MGVQCSPRLQTCVSVSHKACLQFFLKKGAQAEWELKLSVKNTLFFQILTFTSTFYLVMLKNAQRMLFMETQLPVMITPPILSLWYCDFETPPWQFLCTAIFASPISDLFVRNLLVTLTAACSESVHVYKAHLKDSFLPSHPSVLLSRSVWFCPQSWRLFTQREAEMWQTICLYCTVSISSSRIFSVALAWTDFLVWHWSPGISLSFPSSSVPLPPGMGSAVEQLSLASSPLVLNMPHDNTVLLWHMSSMGPATQLMIKHDRWGI